MGTRDPSANQHPGPADAPRRFQMGHALGGAHTGALSPPRLAGAWRWKPPPATSPGRRPDGTRRGAFMGPDAARHPPLRVLAQGM